MPQMIDEVLENLEGDGEFDPFDYALPLLLQFRSAEARSMFLGQLSDGLMENAVEVHWPGRSNNQPMRGGPGPYIVQVWDCHTGEEVK